MQAPREQGAPGRSGADLQCGSHSGKATQRKPYSNHFLTNRRCVAISLAAEDERQGDERKETGGSKAQECDR